MKIKTFSLILLIFAIMLPFSAGADTIVSVDLTGFSGYYSHGYGISPYFANVNGVSNTLWCVDVNHWDNIGDHWTAYVTPVMSVVPGDHTYLHNLNTYEKMAWLIQQYNVPSGDPDPTHRQAAIQWLIWDLSSGGNHSYYFPDEYNFWNTQMLGAYATGNYAGWVILTDINRCDQEFIEHVPEPSVVLLLGSGLVGLWGFRRRFRK